MEYDKHGKQERRARTHLQTELALNRLMRQKRTSRRIFDSADLALQFGYSLQKTHDNNNDDDDDATQASISFEVRQGEGE